MGNFIRVVTNIVKVVNGQQGVGSIPNKVFDVATDSELASVNMLYVNPYPLKTVIPKGVIESEEVFLVIRHCGQSGILKVNFGDSTLSTLHPREQLILPRTNLSLVSMTADKQIPVELVLHEIINESRPNTDDVISAEDATNLSQGLG
jgi:hypothetical protein